MSHERSFDRTAEPRSVGRQEKCVLVGDFAADGNGTVNRGKMYTFVSVKKTIDSKRYAEIVYTFVYLVEKTVSAKSRG